MTNRNTPSSVKSSAESSTNLVGALFYSERMRSVFSDAAWLQRMLDFEAALAKVEAAVEVIPAAASPTIESQCQAVYYDIAELAAGTALAGNPVIPLVKALTRRVKGLNAEAARYVHWGATSQDVMDSALVLQLREALILIDEDLIGLARACAQLAEVHRHTPMVGRTWLQQALPITFGFKAAGWLSAIERHRQRLHELRPRVLVLQFGGAAGTLASLGKLGPAVAQVLAEELDLTLPDMPWHGHRDRIVEVATFVGVMTGTLGKIAGDLALMMQTEIGECAEPSVEGKGGSSTMPHKRNPVGAAVVLAAATRVPGLVAGLLGGMVQEHERGLGGWHAEWQSLPEILCLASGALSQLRRDIEGLEVNAQRMRDNLETSRGLIMAEAVTMALAESMGLPAAHELVERACGEALTSGAHLRAILATRDEVRHVLNAQQLDALFDPLQYTGATQLFITRALATHNEKQ